MTRIKYPTKAILEETKYVDGEPVTESVERIAYAFLPNTEENREKAEMLSCTGEYTIEDDGQPDPGPTQLDRIEAQTTYTAMMTDTLLEEV